MHSSKGHSKKKVTPGIAATENRLETSRTVQNTLKNIGDEEELSFLKGPAESVIAILGIIQSIEDGDIDHEFSGLALDSCGLVYLVIHKCAEHINRDGQISRQMELDAKDLKRNLDDIHIFFQKKAGGSFYRRHNIRKRSEDEHRIIAYRSQLRIWMVKFGGGGTQESIHDALQEVIDKKIREHEQEEHAARKAKDHAKLQELGITKHDVGIISVSDDRARVEPNAEELQESLELEYLEEERPQKTIISSQTNDLGLTPKVSDAELKAAADAKKQQRLEEEQQAKKAERQRWRKSEQKFSQLPPAEPDDEDGENHLDHKKLVSTLLEKPPATASSLKPVDPPKPTPVDKVDNKVPVPVAPSEQEELAAARALHEQLQKELEAEDEQKAILLAARLQREWEAEEENAEFNSTTPPKPRKSARRQSTRSSGSESLYSGDDEEELPPHILEELNLDDDFDDFDHPAGSPKQSSYSPAHSPKPEHIDPRTPYSARRSPSPRLNEPSYISPHETFQGHPPGLAQPQPLPSMQFTGITGSGISLGGGPVHVTNDRSGNTTHTYIHDRKDF
ncbi:hypothetical protein BDZ97DRAFT_1426740 [Flammula alnicola]|nr:hypothetical protein BDZ97DRAFT_1426740 [Flammula alnicola]